LRISFARFFAVGTARSAFASVHTAIATDDGSVEPLKVRKVIALPAVRDLPLANGNLVGPEIVIATTRYRTGLEPMVGKLGLLGGKGVPLSTAAIITRRCRIYGSREMRPNVRGCVANAPIQRTLQCKGHCHITEARETPLQPKFRSAADAGRSPSSARRMEPHPAACRRSERQA